MRYRSLIFILLCALMVTVRCCVCFAALAPDQTLQERAPVDPDSPMFRSERTPQPKTQIAKKMQDVGRSLTVISTAVAEEVSAVWAICCLLA